MLVPEVAILAVSTVILTLTDYVGDPINVSIRNYPKLMMSLALSWQG